jgi:succinyl-diaminopimelate desuccinylase
VVKLDEIYTKIAGLAASFQDEALDAAGGLIKIPSVAADQAAVKLALEWMLERAARMGFRTSQPVKGKVGVVEFGQGEETVGVLVHVDVVPPGEGWSFDPFAGQRKDGWLLGRGAMDDKGPAAGALYAMKILQQSGLPVRKKILLVIGTGEETDWEDIVQYKEVGPLPDYGFTPDGQFPLTSREKGYADVELDFADRPGGHQAETAIVSMGGGEATNMIPGKAFARLGGNLPAIRRHILAAMAAQSNYTVNMTEEGELLKVSVAGKATHAGYPERGMNAIAGLCALLADLPLAGNCWANLARFVAEKTPDYYGKNLGLYGETEYFHSEFIHRNVVSPTLIKTDGEKVSLVVNLRTSLGTTEADIAAAFAAFAGHYGYAFQVHDYWDPIHISQDRPFLQKMAAAYETVTGEKGEYKLARCMTYAKALPAMVSLGPVFPGETDCRHEKDERLSETSFVKAMTIYALALANLVTCSEPLA